MVQLVVVGGIAIILMGLHFLGVFRICETLDDPPFVFVEDAVMPLAHR